MELQYDQCVELSGCTRERIWYLLSVIMLKRQVLWMAEVNGLL